MAYTLTQEQLGEFKNDGVTCLRGVVSPEQIETLRAAVQRDIENPGPKFYGYQTEGDAQFHGNQELWQTDEDFAAYCLRSELPALAAQFLESEKINLYYDQLFVKEPGADAPTPWHNDQPYWGISGWQVMSFWLALDPVSRESGAVEYVRGSHKWDRWYQPKPFAKGATHSYTDNPDYVDMPDIDNNRDDYDFVIYDMEPGDLLAFHSLIIHGSAGNTHRKNRRRGYAVRYAGDDVRYDERPGTSVPLHEASLNDGDLLDSERFPVVWRREAEKAA